MGGSKELPDSQAQLLKCGKDEREKKDFLDETTSGSEDSSSVIAYSFHVTSLSPELTHSGIL